VEALSSKLIVVVEFLLVNVEWEEGVKELKKGYR
jgi:hypothetical protein